jgi:hypothetical protein
MTFRVLSALPWLAAAAVIAIGASVAGATNDVILRAPLDAVRVAAAAACVVAATAFEPGERLRRAWLLNGVFLIVLFARDITLALWPNDHRVLGVAVAHWQNALVLIGNGCAVTGTWLMARTWRVARISLPGSLPQQRTLVIAAAAVALAITGGSLLVDIRSVMNGAAQGIVDFVSRVSDVIELCLIVPVALTALALRGGRLGWPWWLLTVSLLSWLFYDAAGTISEFVAVDPRAVRVPREVLRTLACGYLGAAALAQRFAVLGAFTSRAED